VNAKFGVASYPSIHIETLRGSTSVYGPDSYEWLYEYLNLTKRELQVITKEKAGEVLVFPNGITACGIFENIDGLVSSISLPPMYVAQHPG